MLRKAVPLKVIGKRWYEYNAVEVSRNLDPIKY
jgi:hypothetical protein